VKMLASNCPYFPAKEIWKSKAPTKERNRRIFKGKILSIQDFKLSFLGILNSWSHVPIGGFNLSLLDFVDKIMYESLRA